MAAVKKTQSNTKNIKVNAVKKQKVKWWVWVIAAGVLLYLSFFIFGYTWINQQRMERSLETRYSQDFVVKWPEHKNQILIGAGGSYESEAYPVSDPSLKFKVEATEAPDTELFGSIVDDYPMTVWEKQETNRLKPIINNLFRGYYKDFEVRLGNMSGDSEDIPIRGTVPSFKDAVRQYGQTVHYTLTINNTAPQTNVEASKQQIAERILALKNYVPASSVNFQFNYLVNTKQDSTYIYLYGVSFGDNNFSQVIDAATIVNDFKATTTWRIK